MFPKETFVFLDGYKKNGCMKYLIKKTIDNAKLKEEEIEIIPSGMIVRNLHNCNGLFWTEKLNVKKKNL